MTDARAIIAKALADLPGAPAYGDADAVLSALTTAGYRILGPDEVDPVTLEKCAAHLEGRGTVFMRDAAAAIRAIGRKA